MVIAQSSGWSHPGWLGVLPIGCPNVTLCQQHRGTRRHWHRGILVMHWGFRNQNNVLCQDVYSQQCSAPFSQAGTLHLVYALWWVMTSRSYLSILGELTLWSCTELMMKCDWFSHSHGLLELSLENWFELERRFEII